MAEDIKLRQNKNRAGIMVNGANRHDNTVKPYLVNKAKENNTNVTVEVNKIIVKDKEFAEWRKENGNPKEFFYNDYKNFCIEKCYFKTTKMALIINQNK